MKELPKYTISCITLFLLPSLLFFLAPAKFPADDGFFYLQIAYNFVQGNGVTFNNEYFTNGFHPLWFLICVFAEAINPFGKEGVLYIIWLIQVGLVFLSLKRLYRFWNTNTVGLTISYAILTIFFLALGTLYLSEAHLNLFCLVLLLTYPFLKKKTSFLLGLFLAMAFLARLDNVFIIASLGIYYLFFNGAYSFRKMMNMGLGFIIPVLPYLMLNYYFFDHFVPVSGVLKSNFPFIAMQGETNYGNIFIAISFIYLIMLSTILKTNKTSRLKLFFTIGSLLQLLYNYVFQSAIGQWYFVAQFIGLALFTYDLIEYVGGKIKISKIILVRNSSVTLCFLLILSITLLKSTMDFSLFKILNGNAKLQFLSEDKVKLLAEKIQNQLPANEKIYVYDAPGKLALYSNLNIIPSDGLVNDHSFSKELKAKGIMKYLKDHNIRYVLIPDNSQLTMDRTSYAGMIISKSEGVLKVECLAPAGSVFVGELDLSRFDCMLESENPLITWQPGYDKVVLLRAR